MESKWTRLSSCAGGGLSPRLLLWFWRNDWCVSARFARGRDEKHGEGFKGFDVVDGGIGIECMWHMNDVIDEILCDGRVRGVGWMDWNAVVDFNGDGGRLF